MGSVAYPFDGRLWTIMNALKPPNDPINLRSGDPLLPAYFDRILNALERTVAGITAGGDEKKLDYYQRALDEVREMRRQYDGT